MKIYKYGYKLPPEFQEIVLGVCNEKDYNAVKKAIDENNRMPSVKIEWFIYEDNNSKT
jgi:hypothetical protein